jgi:hypothetical protein
MPPRRAPTEFQKRAIMDFAQPVRDMDAEIGVDPDQVAVDVSGIEQPRLGQSGDRSATSVGARDGIAKRYLVQTSL